MFPILGVFAIGPFGPEWLLALGALLFVPLFVFWLGARYIPNQQVGVIEKLWSRSGSVPEGRIIALDGEAGYQADLLRGGLHFGLWRWQYRVHKCSLVTIPQGQIGYVYARDGDPLQPSQTLGRVAMCNYFQDARAHLGETADTEHPSSGQRGRQRGILREGVYAINPALFVVITEDSVYQLAHMLDHREAQAVAAWHSKLKESGDFRPLVIGAAMTIADPAHPDKALTVDSIGIVTIHDGPSLPVGEIIAPPVGNEANALDYHNNYQDSEAFLRAGGRRTANFGCCRADKGLSPAAKEAAAFHSLWSIPKHLFFQRHGYVQGSGRAIG